PTAKLLVVGSGFFNEEAKLRAAADRMGLSDRVAITGRVPEDALPAYLSLADVAIYPMADTLLNRAKSPVKVIEPMLMGIPVGARYSGQPHANQHALPPLAVESLPGGQSGQHERCNRRLGELSVGPHCQCV